MTERTRASRTERQRFIDRVFISELSGVSGQNPSAFTLERAYNSAEEAWDLREDRIQVELRKEAVRYQREVVLDIRKLGRNSP